MMVSAVVIARGLIVCRASAQDCSKPRLRREHLLLLGRLAVVVAEQVQHAVRAEQVQLVLGAVTCRRRLRPGDVRAEHDVTEQRRRRVLVVVAVVATVVQLVHREGEYVGRSRLVHEVLVQRRHRRYVDQPDRQLHQRVHAHLVEHVTARASPARRRRRPRRTRWPPRWSRQESVSDRRDGASSPGADPSAARLFSASHFA